MSEVEIRENGQGSAEREAVENAKKVLDKSDIRDNFDLMFSEYEENDNLLNFFHKKYMDSMRWDSVKEAESSEESE